MGEPVLLLRLEGPLQAWGGRSRWDVRDTQPEPSKSGVIGLLACALGYGRGDARTEALDRALRFGVRVEAPGHILEDYQTVTGYLPTADGRYKHSGTAVASSLGKLNESAEATTSTIISPRYYLEDAAFLVGLTARDSQAVELLTQAASAVRAPRWPLFLGRKACVPTRPIFDTFTESYEGLEHALQRHPWSWRSPEAQPDARSRAFRPADELLAFVEDDRGPLRRQDAVRVNAVRAYGFVYFRALRIPRSEVTS